LTETIIFGRRNHFCPKISFLSEKTFLAVKKSFLAQNIIFGRTKIIFGRKNQNKVIFFRLPQKFCNFFLDKDMLFACDRVGNFELLLPNTNLISPPGGATFIL